MFKFKKITWLAYQKYRVHTAEPALMRREHLMQVQLQNDNLKAFLNDWNEVLLEMSEFVDDGMLATLFRTQLDACTLMTTILENYDWERFKTGAAQDMQSCMNLPRKSWSRSKFHRITLQLGRSRALATQGLLHQPDSLIQKLSLNRRCHLKLKQETVGNG